jgi:hypothetical protein
MHTRYLEELIFPTIDRSRYFFLLPPTAAAVKAQRREGRKEGSEERVDLRGPLHYKGPLVSVPAAEVAINIIIFLRFATPRVSSLPFSWKTMS